MVEDPKYDQTGNLVRWYVLTLPTADNGHYKGNPGRKLQAELDRRIRHGEPVFEYFAPTYTEIRKTAGKLVRTNRPLLYNYVFVHASEAEIYRMKRYVPQYNFLPRVHDGHCGYHPYLSDEAMQNLKWVAEAYSNELPLYIPESTRLIKGDRIRITKGQFKGVEACVVSRPGAGKKDLMVCVENCMYVPLLSVEPDQYEIITLNADCRHVYARLNDERLFSGLHDALQRYHSLEGVTMDDRLLAGEVLRSYGSVQVDSDILRCKLYAMLLPTFAILNEREKFSLLLGTIRQMLPHIKAKYAKALLLVTVYGCTNNPLYRSEAHALIDSWREDSNLKKRGKLLVRHLDDYDKWLKSC